MADTGSYKRLGPRGPGSARSPGAAGRPIQHPIKGLLEPGFWKSAGATVFQIPPMGGIRHGVSNPNHGSLLPLSGCPTTAPRPPSDQRLRSVDRKPPRPCPSVRQNSNGRSKSAPRPISPLSHCPRILLSTVINFLIASTTSKSRCSRPRPFLFDLGTRLCPCGVPVGSTNVGGRGGGGNSRVSDPVTRRRPFMERPVLHQLAT
jgi:hypothetical protein